VTNGKKEPAKNTNFLIRNMLEGETDFRNLTQRQVRRNALLLNERPRQTSLDVYVQKEIQNNHTAAGTSQGALCNQARGGA